MDDSLYDEFGNYLGPDLEDEDDDLELEEEDEEPQYEEEEEEEEEEEQEGALMQIDGILFLKKEKKKNLYSFLFFLFRHSCQSNSFT
jgi:U5 small nuclear ribonucleoprotein component